MAGNLNKKITFLWEGTDRRGNRTKGEILGPTAAVVKAELRRQGISPKRVRPKPVGLFRRGPRKVSAKDISVFSRQIATMMSSGVPLVQAFDIIGRGSDHSGMQALVTAIKGDVEGGSSLAQALRKHPQQFDDLFCNLVRAGEQAGILENLLNKIAAYKEKTEAIKAKIKKAMFYPVSVILVAFIVTIILMVFVVPKFEEMFSNLGGELPLPTRFVISTSEVLQEIWLFILGGLAIAGLLFARARKRSDSFNDKWDSFVLRLPLIGTILRKAAIARYARTLATMFAAGVPLVDALDSVAGATGNRVYARGVQKIREDVATGQQLQLAMSQTKLFPNMAVQMVAIGEESGSLDTMLGKVADFYEQEVDDAVDSLSSLMEPFIMVVLGTIIGGLIVAMYLPIFEMGSVV